MKKPKFLRSDSKKYSRLGVRRKNKQVYRKSKGGENKIRLNMKGHLRNVKVGFRTPRKTRGLINGKQPVLIHNLKELKLLTENQIGIVAKIGDKKRTEIAEYAEKNKIQLVNLNPKKFLKNIRFILNRRKQEKQERDTKKIKSKKESEKKAKEKEEKDKQEENKEEKTQNKDNEKIEEKKKEKVIDNQKAILSNNYGRGK
ncbi:MAG: eL32 family ribosomal protein [Candidatus Pacearchaeota archaeon]